MKTNLTIIAFSICTVLTPIVPLVLIAVVAIILDTCFGIWKSIRKGGWKSIRSRRLSHTISKTLLYSGAIVFVFLLEKYVVADILGHFIAIDLLMTKAFTTFCVYTEIKSINESYFSVTGINVWDKFKSFAKRSKETLEDLK
jgi:hypothetical protein